MLLAFLHMNAAGIFAHAAGMPLVCRKRPSVGALQHPVSTVQ
jgi:hypothetical protein